MRRGRPRPTKSELFLRTPGLRAAGCTGRTMAGSWGASISRRLTVSYNQSTFASVAARATLTIIAAFLVTASYLPPEAFADNPDRSSEASTSDSGPSSGQPGFSLGKSEAEEEILGGGDEYSNGGNPPSPNQPRYSYIWVPASEFSDCDTDLNGGSWSCTPHPESCEAGTGSQFAGEGDALQIGTVSTTPVEGVTQRGTRIDNETGET